MTFDGLRRDLPLCLSGPKRMFGLPVVRALSFWGSHRLPCYAMETESAQISTSNALNEHLHRSVVLSWLIGVLFLPVLVGQCPGLSG